VRRIRALVRFSRAWAAAAIVLVLASPVAAQEERVIRIATEGGYPPFNYVDAANEPQGFEVDLARALCQAMGVTCTIVLQDWDDMIDALNAKRFDAIMASMKITDERRWRIAFSKPYYRAPSAFVGSRDAALGDAGPSALREKTIGAVQNSEHAAFLEDLYKGSSVKLYATLEDASLDLATGRIDLVFGDKIALAKFLQTPQGSCCRFIADAPANPAYFGEGVGVGLRKQDKELKEMFNRAIDQVMADGTYDRIRSKYFAFDIR
jgi:polar amino acid transport system substrate-binding protein